jgi:hypothetical protein
LIPKGNTTKPGVTATSVTVISEADRASVAVIVAENDVAVAVDDFVSGAISELNFLIKNTSLV